MITSESSILYFGVTACGADSGVDDWITRTTHDTEKMANANKDSRLSGDNRVAWVEYIRSKLKENLK